MADPAPVPAVTRDPEATNEQTMAEALALFGWTCGPEFWERYYSDPWVFNLANAVERLARASEAPQRCICGPRDDDPSDPDPDCPQHGRHTWTPAELVDGIPEHLHVDLMSTIQASVGDNGQVGQVADWVVDVMAALSPLIARALADAASEAPQPKVLCKGWVVDAGGGQVGVVVDRDTEAYPSPGARVAVVVALGPPVPQTPAGCADGHVCCTSTSPAHEHFLDPSDCPACGYPEAPAEAAMPSPPVHTWPTQHLVALLPPDHREFDLYAVRVRRLGTDDLWCIHWLASVYDPRTGDWRRPATAVVVSEVALPLNEAMPLAKRLVGEVHVGGRRAVDVLAPEEDTPDA